MFGKRGRKRKAAAAVKAKGGTQGSLTRCAHCGGEIKLDEDTGAQVCSSCGNIAVQASQEVVESNPQNLARSRGSVIQRKVPKHIPKPVVKPEDLLSGTKEDRLFALADKHAPVFKRYQEPSAFRRISKPDYISILMALDLLVAATVQALRMKVRVGDREVHRVQVAWDRYKKRLKQDKVSLSKCYGNATYRVSLGQVAPVPSVIIPIIVLILRTSTLPVLVWDVLEMYRNGTLPLSDTMAIFPQKLRDRLRAVTPLFRKVNLHVKAMHERTEAVAAYLKMPYARKLAHQNELVIALRFIVRLRFLPLKAVWPYLMNIYVNRHDKQDLHDIVDVAAMVAAAITCVPGWWDTYVIHPYVRSKDPAKRCFEEIARSSNMLFVGEPECFNNLDRMHQLYDGNKEAQFWRYMDFLETNMTAKIAVPNGIDKHLTCFAKEPTGTFTIQLDTSVQSESESKAKGKVMPLSVEKEKALARFVDEMTIKRAKRKNSATDRFIRGDYLEARRKWVGARTLVVRGSFAVPRYVTLEVECKWVLDLLCTVLNLNTEDKPRLLATTARNFFFKKPPEDLTKQVAEVVKINNTIIKRIRASPHLYENIYDWKSPQSSSSSSSTSAAASTPVPSAP